MALDDRALIELLEQAPVASQAALRERLAARGLLVDQSTLSRHLRRLGFTKRDGRYRRELPTTSLLRALTVVPPNLLVLRTDPGFASALAARLDAEPLPGQAGTLAGDDTVFVAVGPDRLADAESAARRRHG